MVHGNPTWSFHFRRLVEALGPSHRAIVPDHIGCGLSDKPDDSNYLYTLESRVDDLEALLAHLDVDRDVSLVLHDWGGMIGMAYAARHPERIARIVVMNTAAFHMPKSKTLPRALWFCRDTLLGALAVRGLNAFAKGTARIGCTRYPLARDVRRAYVEPYDSWDHRIAIHRFVQDIPLRAGDRSFELVSWVQDRLPELAEVPMLIAWGMKDFVFDHHFLGEWIRRFPRAEVLRFEESGHYVLEDESERLVPAIAAFVGRAEG
jgi:haloalkane dehalogenase